MKWSEAIAKIDWNDPHQVEDWADITGLVTELGYEYYDACFYGEAVQRRVKKVWLKRWLCTDTYVGAAAYFLDGEIITISWQNARKNDEYFYFVSAGARNKMKDFICSLQDEQGDEFSVANLEDEIP